MGQAIFISLFFFNNLSRYLSLLQGFCLRLVSSLEKDGILQKCQLLGVTLIWNAEERWSDVELIVLAEQWVTQTRSLLSSALQIAGREGDHSDRQPVKMALLPSFWTGTVSVSIHQDTCPRIPTTIIPPPREIRLLGTSGGISADVWKSCDRLSINCRVCRNMGPVEEALIAKPASFQLSSDIHHCSFLFQISFISVNKLQSKLCMSTTVLMSRR